MQVGVVPSAKDGLHCGGKLGTQKVITATRVVPSAKDGLHCGIVVARAAFRPRQVVPSAKDGLHCGNSRCREPCPHTVPSSRPPRTGSIAACRTAPGTSTANRVVPSAKDGLHCGRLPGADLASRMLVVPSAKDGLHCGSRNGQ